MILPAKWMYLERVRSVSLAAFNRLGLAQLYHVNSIPDKPPSTPSISINENKYIYRRRLAYFALKCGCLVKPLPLPEIVHIQANPQSNSTTALLAPFIAVWKSGS